MATLNVTLVKSQSKSGYNGPLPVIRSVPAATPEDITLSVSAQATTATVPTGAEPSEYIWRLVVSGGNCRVRFGTTTAVSATNDMLLLDGGTYEWGATVVGEKVSAITATIS